MSTIRESILSSLAVDLPSEDDDEEEAEAPLTAQSAPFTLKETSGESSDTDEDGSDDDSSSSVSSSSTSAKLKLNSKAGGVVAVMGGKRLASGHTTGQGGGVGGGEKAAAVVHRKVVRPSQRQHRLSSRHHSALRPARPSHSTDLLVASRALRKKAHAHEAAGHDVVPATLQTEAAEESVPSLAPSGIITSLGAESISASPSSSPRSSNLTSYALLVAILRRSDGRDKLVKTAYYGTNELRWLMHSIVAKLAGNQRLTRLLFGGSSSPPLVLRRLAMLAVACGRRLDVALGHFGDAMGSARQLLRFGRWVSDLQSLQEAWQEWKDSRNCLSPSSSPSSSLIPLLELINAFVSLLIDLFDDVEWLSEQLILPSPLAPFAGAASAALWLLTVCIDIPLTLGALWAMRGEGGSEWRAECLSLVKYAGDGLYALSLVSAVAGWRMNEGLAQGGGLLSALVSLYKLSRSQKLHRMVL